MKPKLTRYAADKNNPAVKGNLTAEEIVRTDWQRNYERKGIPLMAAKRAIKEHVDAGGAVFRMRNTLILVTPEDGYIEVEFHTVTADPMEVYQSMMLMFFLGLNEDQGTETATTYVDDKSPFRMIKRMVGPDFVDIDESDNPDVGKYVITMDIGPFARAMQAQAAKQGK
jgi:hypothetical protein